MAAENITARNKPIRPIGKCPATKVIKTSSKFSDSFLMFSVLGFFQSNLSRFFCNTCSNFYIIRCNLHLYLIKSQHLFISSF